MDITHRLDYLDLAEDAATVFESLNMIEREVRSSDQRWYIARLLPYRSSEDHIDGTVLTFIDITKRRAPRMTCAGRRTHAPGRRKHPRFRNHRS
jgi:two-component system CheB/CheR fusion protein